jgi:aspartyl/asparaginyl beta-hydroxylase (cupin superfamily)
MSISARLVAGKIMRTSASHRPAPSLFYYPGLNSQPFYNTENFPFVRDFETNLKTIQTEYWSLRSAYGDRDDYIKADGEHTLNDGGKWKWMNFVEKGNRVNQHLFKEHCPVLTELINHSIGRDLMTGTPFSYTFFSTMSP